MTDEETVKMAQKLYDYCQHRHEINPKGYFKSGEMYACRGCPFLYHGSDNLYDCNLTYPFVWPVYPEVEGSI